MTQPAARIALPLAVLLALGACSRAAPQKSAAEAAPAAAPEASKKRADDTPAGEKEAPAAAMPELPPAAEEEPSLSQPPAKDALGPSEQDEVERLESEERQFQQAIDPEALSCGGALPRRDAICSLADKICELTPPTLSLTAQEDCDKAKSACTNAKAAYKSRCGG